MKYRLLGAVLLAAGVMVGSVLNFQGTTAAAPPNPNVPPFASPSANRNEMINELRVITQELRKQNDLLTEQNNLLKSGKLQVVVMLDQKTN
ncbi:MAG: hypothetical protein JW719_11365 [Pirellulales bacterium]|nr:hypothetical protein [Pirellulales bacterium]